MNKLLILLILTALYSSFCYAIIGKVTDKKSGEALKDVKIINLSQPTINSELSNKRGLFEIDGEDGDLLRFEYDGYNSLELEVNQIHVVRAQIEPEQVEAPTHLNTLLSTADRQSRTVSELPASIVVLTKQQIAERGYLNIEEILRHIPGLYAIEEYDWTGNGSNLGVRGFLTSGMNNAVLIMVNGVSQGEDTWGMYPLSRINVPVGAIERIEITRGPMTVAYGSSALQGAINIITHSETEDDRRRSQDHGEYLSITSNSR
jgi:outer membrane receptor for Fe3+-dicitrate